MTSTSQSENLFDEEIDWDEDAPAQSRKMKKRYVLAVALICAFLWCAARAGSWLGTRVVETTATVVSGSSALEARYEQWKQAHAQSVATLMDCYASDAIITRENGQKQNYQDLVNLAQFVRQDRSYDQVTDALSPRIETAGSRAVIHARHRYGHSNPNYPPLLGDRVLAWERRGDRWFIVEDYFPPAYTPTR